MSKMLGCISDPGMKGKDLQHFGTYRKAPFYVRKSRCQYRRCKILVAATRYRVQAYFICRFIAYESTSAGAVAKRLNADSRASWGHDAVMLG
jgi:hypothetical protein